MSKPSGAFQRMTSVEPSGRSPSMFCTSTDLRGRERLQFRDVGFAGFVRPRVREPDGGRPPIEHGLVQH